MSSERYSTSDLWLGALLLSETEAELMDVQISRHGRETVFFTFSGEGISRMAQAYCENKALANVTELRKKMNDLRDLVFQAREGSSPILDSREKQDFSTCEGRKSLSRPTCHGRGPIARVSR